MPQGKGSAPAPAGSFFLRETVHPNSLTLFCTGPHNELRVFSPMEWTQNKTDWLSWLSRVRFLVITCLLATALFLWDTGLLRLNAKMFGTLVMLWYTLS